MERLVGDKEFRAKLGVHDDTPQVVVAEEYGIDIDPDQARPLYHTAYMRHRRTPEAEQWPLSVMWDTWIDDMIAHRELICAHGRCADVNPVFDAWRVRQVNRAASELGTSAPAIVHPIAAYELSEGCSVGCWFCGISADRFKGWQPYTPEVADPVAGHSAGHMVDLFGQAAQTGFCYWATDPADNPDYPKFIEDHYHVTGALPQTTTAAPLKDLKLTREVLGLFDRYMTVTNRFSIVNHKTLKGVHETFTAEELIGVELVQQQNEALQGKADAGRARVRRLRLEAAGKADKYPALRRPAHDDRLRLGLPGQHDGAQVKLVAPTRSDEVWPLGYRVYSEARFDTAGSSARRSRDDRASHAEAVPPDERALLPPRPGVPAAGGRLQLATRSHLFTFNSPHARAMGDMISTGTMTAGGVTDHLVRGGHDIFLVTETIQNLYDSGLLNDDPACSGIGCNEPLRVAS